MKNLIFTLLLLCSASFSFAQNVPAYVPTNGLVGWWPFNGNANDESGNGNNGLVSGAVLTNDRFGIQNMAYLFNGISDKIQIADANSLDLTNNYTLSAWYFTNSTTQLDQAILGKANQTGGTGYQLLVNTSTLPNNPKLQFGYNNSNGINGGVTTPATASNLSGWHLLTGTYDGVSGKIYLDGILMNTISISYSLANSSQPLLFGNESNSLSRFFNGKLDDIGFWNRALTQQEITALYQSCNLNLSINPINANGNIGSNISFNASGATTYQWQSNPAGIGWYDLNNNAIYNGANTASLSVNNLQLQNHQQEFRVIGSTGNCADTTYSTITLADTCVNTVFDTVTTFISVTDTLIINAVISSVNPPNNVNTFLIYPNPANTHITIDNGNFATMAGYSVRINNALGQVVFNQNITQQQFFIDLSSWTGPGLYYVNILDPNGNPIEVKKIVIQ